MEEKQTEWKNLFIAFRRLNHSHTSRDDWTFLSDNPYKRHSLYFKRHLPSLLFVPKQVTVSGTDFISFLKNTKTYTSGLILMVLGHPSWILPGPGWMVETGLVFDWTSPKDQMSGVWYF